MEDNLRAMDEERYKTEMVCVYCGNPMIEPYLSCCGEVHYDTQENIDFNEWVESQERAARRAKLGDK